MGPARLNNRGFTLVEFLVAIVILSVGLLGLLQVVNFSIDNNMNTRLRDEAVRLADERLTTEKSRVFKAISTNTRANNITVNLNNASKNFTVSKTTTETSNNTKNIQIDVSWGYKGKTYSHTATSLVSETVY